MTEPTNAGIITVGDERWIPGSRRADGSYRKERKVRPGFTPLEDLQRYINPRAREQQAGNARILPLKKKQQQSEQDKPKERPPPPAPSEDLPLEKKIRNLQKKIRQVSELEQKLIKGEKLDENQREKVKKGKALREELARLTASSSSSAEQ